MVQNSDSDTDDSMELQDLDFGVKEKPRPVEESPTVNSANERRNYSPALRSGAYRRTQKSALRRPSDKPPQTSKSTLKHLVAEAHKLSEIEKSIAESKAEMERPIEEFPVSEFVINEEVLAGVMKDDEDGDKARRLYLAMQRTNALDYNNVFHLFDHKFSIDSLTQSPFPSECLPKHGWVVNFEDIRSRKQSILSGHARQVFQFQELPEELASWMVEQICLGQSDILSAKCIQLLEVSTILDANHAISYLSQDHPHHLQTLFTRDILNNIFRWLGADMECIKPQKPVAPSLQPVEAPKQPPPPALKWILHLLRSSAYTCNAKAHLLYLLFHLCFDDSIMADADILHLLQDTIESIVCSIPPQQLASVLNDFIPLLLARISHPVLQNNLVQSLPTNTPLTTHLQRHLALAFLIYPKQLIVPPTDPSLPVLISEHIRDSPDYVLHKQTNYSFLTARLALLDIGIGPGLTTVPFTPALVSTPVPGDSSVVSTAAPTPIFLSPEQLAFNKHVDNLADLVKDISNRIVEDGAMSDMTRLDAKDASERLYHRLNGAVRIGGPLKWNIFESEEMKTRAEKPLSRFFKRLGDTRASSVSGETDGAKSEAASVDGTTGI
ncbi:hypothetical protein BCR34DRAFT_303778 [Clohesyomyces aquaticus]|uniref:Uncharacterized protein n=1 Tax=Clohesyomyces aquaticus TaxID=1231657 RepID=A0A1Y1ZQ14_9PLEO|nr:hypothetical protein BCR34DRAFT_303778 [Clohesyomyces aquaticus]